MSIAFVASFISPVTVEGLVRKLLQLEIERRVDERIDDLSSTRLVEFAQRALGKTDKDMEATRQAIRASVPQKVAEVVANMLNADCECRKRLKDVARQSEMSRLDSLGQLRDRLTSFVESTYAQVRDHLLREFRIFTGSNALALALLGGISYWRRGAAFQLLLPAVVILGAASITGSLYLFQQDWLHTILFSDYVGFAYLGYFSAVALLLADVVFNRARVTTEIFNALANLVGSALQASPC